MKNKDHLPLTKEAGDFLKKVFKGSGHTSIIL